MDLARYLALVAFVLFFFFFFFFLSLQDVKLSPPPPPPLLLLPRATHIAHQAIRGMGCIPSNDTCSVLLALVTIWADPGMGSHGAGVVGGSIT